LPGARALGFDVLSYPRVDGSTSTHPLAVILASRMLNVRYEWRYPEPTGYPWSRVQEPGPRLPDVGAGYRYRDAEFDIAASRVFALGEAARDQRIAAMINGMLAANTNTHDAYVNVIEGKCDVNLTARGPSADEAKLAREKNVELELVPIAVDGLVFIVHRDNAVKGLTLNQIKAVYRLETKSWKDVGGADKAIQPFLREANSGSRELFDTLVMKTPTDEKYTRAMRELFSGSMSGPYNQVTQRPEGLGYSVYYYEHFMALSIYTRNLAINGVEPTAETLASGKYPLSSPVYAVVRKSDPPTAAGRKLVGYLTSAEGQKLLREAGYVPVGK
jgi:ABC-type phosphate transport system substrate-binding protein